MKQHFTQDEQQKFVLARTFLSVYWIQPICDGSGKICGSRVRFAFSGDTGGSIPAWIQNKVGPQTAFDSVQGLLDYVGQKRA